MYQTWMYDSVNRITKDSKVFRSLSSVVCMAQTLKDVLHLVYSRGHSTWNLMS